MCSTSLPAQLSIVFASQAVLVFPSRPAVVRRALRGPQPTTAQLAFARKVARLVWRRLGGKVELDDCEGYAMLGLLDALSRFDASRGCLEQFAHRRIEGAIYDGLREMGLLSRNAHRTAGRCMRRVDLDDAPGEHLVADCGDLDVESALDRHRAIGRLRSAVACLSRREAEFITRCDLGSETLEQVGREMGISKSRACHLRSQARERLLEAL